MIGELAPRDNVTIGGLEGSAKSGWIAQAGERGNAAFGENLQRLRVPDRIDQPTRRMDDFAPSSLRTQPSNALTYRSTFRRCHQIGSAEADDVGPCQTGHGFAEHAAGKDVVETERL